MSHDAFPWLVAFLLFVVSVSAPGVLHADELETPVPGDPAPSLEVESWVAGPGPETWDEQAIVLAGHWPAGCENCDELTRGFAGAWSRLHERYPELVIVLVFTDSADDVQTLVEAVPQLADGTVSVARVRETGWIGGKTFRHQIVDAQGNLVWREHADDPVEYEWLLRVISQLHEGTWTPDDAVERRASFFSTREALRRLATTATDPAGLVALADEAAALGVDMGLVWQLRARFELGQVTAAYLLIDRMAAEHPDDANVLNNAAWAIVASADAADQDLDLALALAERANALTDHSNVAYLDTLARVHHARGDLERALELQRQAAEHVGDDDNLRAHVERWLERYEREATVDPGAQP